ncbi:MAG TPA: hypothetical protein VGT79_10775 [Xanthomonadaceae bacterium]|nr:hypothetical protein [Xanthomonadaceae bacterium]
MRVYDISPPGKGLVAFEINASVGRRVATRVVSKIKGVRILRRPRLLARIREDVFCEFRLKGELFNIWQPVRGSGRYWIGSSNGEKSPVLLQIRQAFVDHQLRASGWLTLWKRQGKGTL